MDTIYLLLGIFGFLVFIAVFFLGGFVFLDLLFKLLQPSDDEQDNIMKRWIPPLHIVLPRVVVGLGLICSAVLAQWTDVLPKAYALPLLVGGAAVLLQLVIEWLIWISVVQDKWDGRKPERHPKSYFESLRFTINVLVVISGVVLGLIQGADFAAKPLTLIALGFGIFCGLLNLNVVSGALDEEYTVTEHDKTWSYITVKTFHRRVLTMLLNFQYLSLLIGLAGIALDR